MNCVFCNTDKDLNTKFTITLDDKSKIELSICDSHAEDATVKNVKEAYLKKETQLSEIIAQARALGYDLIPGGSNLVIAQQPQAAQTPQPQQHAQQPQPQRNQIVPPKNKKTIASKVVDQNIVESYGGNLGIDNAQRYNSHNFDLEDKLPDEIREGYVEIERVEGPAGIPIDIPKSRIDGTGTTIVTINKITDADLQNRFKQMASNSMNDHQPNHNSPGYGFRNCPLCRGEGSLRDRTGIIACPKCKGLAVL